MPSFTHSFWGGKKGRSMRERYKYFVAYRKAKELDKVIRQEQIVLCFYWSYVIDCVA